MRKLALKRKNAVILSINVKKLKKMHEKSNRKVQNSFNLSDRNVHIYFVFDENKKWTYLDIFR